MTSPSFAFELLPDKIGHGLSVTRKKCDLSEQNPDMPYKNSTNSKQTKDFTVVYQDLIWGSQGHCTLSNDLEMQQFRGSVIFAHPNPCNQTSLHREEAVVQLLYVPLCIQLMSISSRIYVPLLPDPSLQQQTTHTTNMVILSLKSQILQKKLGDNGYCN